MKKILIALAFGFCASANACDIETQAQELASDVGRVDLKAGVTREQANVIAQHYCHRYIAGCGAAYPAANQVMNWEFTPRTGVAGVPDAGPILIEKHTGKISWGKGPAISLFDLIESKEEAPKPINKHDAKSQHLQNDASSSIVKIQFDVLPSGSTSNLSFKRSTKNLKCDLAAKRIVEGWRFSHREHPIALIANVKTCSN